MTDWDDLTEGAVDEDAVRADEAERRAVETISTADLLDRAAVVADELKNQRDMIDALKKGIATNEAELARVAKQIAPGQTEAVFEHKGRRVKVTDTERWKWDKEGLEARFGGEEELPPYVTRSFTVRKPVYEKLPEDQQAELREFLTIEGGSPKVDVSVNADAPDLTPPF